MGNAHAASKAKIEELQADLRKAIPVDRLWKQDATENPATDSTSGNSDSQKRQRKAELKEFKNMCKLVAKTGKLDPDAFMTETTNSEFRRYQACFRRLTGQMDRCTGKEFRDGLMKFCYLRLPHCSPELFEMTCRLFDSDEDGFITVHEFIFCCVHACSTVWHAGV